MSNELFFYNSYGDKISFDFSKKINYNGKEYFYYEIEEINGNEVYIITNKYGNISKEKYFKSSLYCLSNTDKQYSAYMKYAKPINSSGRLIHYICVYCGLQIADQCKYGSGKVTYMNNLFAIYDYSRGYPYFIFYPSEYIDKDKISFYSNNQERILNGITWDNEYVLYNIFCKENDDCSGCFYVKIYMDNFEIKCPFVSFNKENDMENAKNKAFDLAFEVAQKLGWKLCVE